MFDLSLERDRKTVEIIQVIFDEFTTDFRLREMRHTRNTQTNEMINMRMNEVAPKWKNFSRTNSLRYRIQHVIGSHNSGYLKFYSDLNADLQIVTSDYQRFWLQRRDNCKEQKRVRDKSITHKRRRKFKAQSKIAAELYEERTANIKTGTYGSGIGTKKTKKSNGKKKKEQKACDCGGGAVHYRSSSKHCLRNKMKKKIRHNNL